MVVLGVWAEINAAPLFFPNVMQATPLFRVLDGRLMPGLAWGVLLVLLGASMFCATKVLSPVMRVAMIAASAWVWLMIGVWLAVDVYRTTGLIAGGGLFWIFGALICLLVMQRPAQIK